MYRRIIGVYLVVVIMLMSVISRSYQIVTIENKEQAAADQGGIVLEIDRRRGTIYDCNFIPLTNTQTIYKAAIAPTPQAVIALSEILPETQRQSARERLAQGGPIVMEVPADFKAESARVFKTYKRYSKEGLASHIIGYIDGDGSGVSGVEQGYDSVLGQNPPLSARYATDARGHILPGVPVKVSGAEQDVRHGVALTLDFRLQLIAENAAKRHIKSGAVLIGDVHSGKLRACVSVPDFDQSEIEKYLDAQGSPLINRALTAYNVGSVFKLCVAAAALESGISPDYEYECSSYLQIGNLAFTCPEAHGKIDVRKAIEQSCNTYFVHLAGLIGAENIHTMAGMMGFGQSRSLCAGIVSEPGRLTKLDVINEQPAALANFAFGQGELMATPLQILNMTAAIAAGGAYIPPELVDGTVEEDGSLIPLRHQPAVRVMSEKTAELLREAMIDVVSQGTGTAGMPAVGGAGGKTATAESGWRREGRKVSQVWFSGFYPAQNPRYTVTILMEDGVSGGKSAAPIFKEIADAISVIE
ncbi:MAG TPA: penicillin-binding protein 2 [Ruminococcaceae bacterium]|nr:penicillin-binding protein 2 [Oscillospiraceae bacterium]